MCAAPHRDPATRIQRNHFRDAAGEPIVSIERSSCASRLEEAGMAMVVPSTRDDRVLAYTRALSLLIIPFLLVAFVLLYFFPGDTKTLFAWTIKPTMTALGF